MARNSVIQAHFPRGTQTPTVQRSPAAVAQRMANGQATQLPANLANFGGGQGQPLPMPVRQQMESYFQTSFADVRVHQGGQAASIGAVAFTQGSNLYFAPGQYNPGTPQGQQLLGHELTHVVQQRAGRVRNPFGAGVAIVQDRAMEAEADRMGMQAAAHRAPVQAKMAGPGIPARAATIQMKCPFCHASKGHSKSCPRHVAVDDTPVERRTAPSTLGSSHSTFTPSGNAVGHGAQAAAGGHTSGKRARMLRAMLENSQK